LRISTSVSLRIMMKRWRRLPRSVFLSSHHSMETCWWNRNIELVHCRLVRWRRLVLPRSRRLLLGSRVYVRFHLSSIPSRVWKLIYSGAKLLQTRSSEITRMRRGLLILLLLLDRDYSDYASYIIAIRHDGLLLMNTGFPENAERTCDTIPNP